MIFAVTILLTAGVLAFVLLVRPQDLPQPEPASPIDYLESRKAVIYDNLRDLNFEYRLGKLSEADYQKTKVTLQNELAGVMAEIDRIAAAAGAKGRQKAPPAKEAAKTPAKDAPANVPPKPAAEAVSVCPHCGAQFPREMKFCGECGKPMTGAAE